MSDLVQMVQPLIPGLRRYARAMLRDATTADDLVQDCLERVVSRWHQRRVEGDVATWTYTILHNLAINYLRGAKRRGTHVALDDAEDPALSRPSSQEDALRHRDLIRALQELPDDQRSVLLLVSVEDMSYLEAAKVLDVPIGTVMSRLARARERLRRRLDEGPQALSGNATLRSVK
ncbi:RNA polymerase sigma factor [Lysobacter terrae]